MTGGTARIVSRRRNACKPEQHQRPERRDHAGGRRGTLATATIDGSVNAAVR